VCNGVFDKDLDLTWLLILVIAIPIIDVIPCFVFWKHDYVYTFWALILQTILFITLLIKRLFNITTISISIIIIIMLFAYAMILRRKNIDYGDSERSIFHRFRWSSVRAQSQSTSQETTATTINNQSTVYYLEQVAVILPEINENHPQPHTNDSNNEVNDFGRVTVTPSAPEDLPPTYEDAIKA
jgi:uncharacterized membrane protein